MIATLQQSQHSQGHLQLAHVFLAGSAAMMMHWV